MERCRTYVRWHHSLLICWDKELVAASTVGISLFLTSPLSGALLSSFVVHFVHLLETVSGALFDAKVIGLAYYEKLSTAYLSSWPASRADHLLGGAADVYCYAVRDVHRRSA